MNLTPLTSGLFLVALSMQICLINTVSSFEFPFPEIKFPLFPKEFNLKDFISLFCANVPDIMFIKSFSMEELKHFVFSIDEIASKLYEKINVFLQKLDYFKISNLSLNWTRWHPDFSCSEFNASGFKSFTVNGSENSLSSESRKLLFDEEDTLSRDLNYQIENKLFGQHIVSWSISKLLGKHFTKDMPKKPLLISFQGPTGSGKSFLTKMIVDSLFQIGFNKMFVHTYYGSRDFFHVKEKENYRKRLLHEIAFLLSLCDRYVIIFEEMDKMVPGVIDAVLPFVSFLKNSTDEYATNSIFIFISNSGAQHIEEIVYDSWLEGISREAITLTRFSSSLKASLYNEPGGFQSSEIIKKNLIDVFLPFLPLEKDHVKLCIIRELHLRKMPINTNIVEYIADQIIYYPPEFQLFAQSGCKRIAQKIDLCDISDL